MVIDRETKVRNVTAECQSKRVTFNGKAGENVKRFIIKFEEILKIYQLSDSELQRVLHSILTGPAHEYFKDNLATFTDWTQARKILEKEFTSSTYDADAEIELLKRKQADGETIAEYLADLKLLNDCQTTPSPNDKLVAIACKHVNPDYYKVIRGKTFASLDEIRKAGQTLEQLFYEKEHFHDDMPKKKTSRISSTYSPYQSSEEIECYGCGKEGKTLISCDCEISRRYRTRKEKRQKKKASNLRSPCPSPAENPRSPKERRVTFEKSDRSSSHSDSEPCCDKRRQHLSRKDQHRPGNE